MRDRFVIYSKNNDLFPNRSYLWQWKNHLLHMKHFQEVSKSDLQAEKIWLEHFLGMVHVWQLRIKLLKFLQWESMGVHDFSIVR